MKLDSEHDRRILLDIISNAQIIGAQAMVVVDIVQRIQSAGIDEPSADKHTRDEGDVLHAATDRLSG